MEKERIFDLKIKIQKNYKQLDKKITEIKIYDSIFCLNKRDVH